MSWSRIATRARVLGIVSACVVGAGCGLIEGWGDEDRADTIDYPIRFRIWEGQLPGFESEPPQLLLSAETAEEYGCSNIGLDLRVTATRDAVDIAIIGLQYAPVCDTAMGPATYDGPFDLEPGVYRLDFRRKTHISTYRLTITGESITIGGEDGDLAVPTVRFVARNPVGDP